ncbi:MAG: PEP-CTERM sorting domain-containing protein [Betaproteobacteria bacterium]|nr:PEP-CTERM sorting domain-containing protein [Betaproteobacteria bacterium]
MDTTKFHRSLFGALVMSGLVSMPAAAATDLHFDFRINQGPVGTTFATLSLDEFAPGTTTFSLDTALSGGSGNPGIVELHFGCNGCGTPTFVPTIPGVTITSNGVQAGYDFAFLATFDPSATSGNTPLMWTATTAPETFLEPTSGSGPDAFALIQLTGGTEVINGQNIESGLYIAAVPEPSTYALILSGLGMVAYGIRRRSSKALRGRIHGTREGSAFRT